MDKPTEDQNLCQHIFKDLYGADGVDKDNPYLAINTFYCEKCLLIKQKTWPRYRYALSQEYIEEFKDNRGDSDHGPDEVG